ncbi:Protein of unknown function [Gryllus bimaculatus]|nr:Protein of unknown function [Gryllus bimaculatus]
MERATQGYCKSGGDDMERLVRGRAVMRTRPAVSLQVTVCCGCAGGGAASSGGCSLPWPCLPARAADAAAPVAAGDRRTEAATGEIAEIEGGRRNASVGGGAEGEGGGNGARRGGGTFEDFAWAEASKTTGEALAEAEEEVADSEAETEGAWEEKLKVPVVLEIEAKARVGEEKVAEPEKMVIVNPKIRIERREMRGRRASRMWERRRSVSFSSWRIGMLHHQQRKRATGRCEGKCDGVQAREWEGGMKRAQMDER